MFLWIDSNCGSNSLEQSTATQNKVLVLLLRWNRVCWELNYSIRSNGLCSIHVHTTLGREAQVNFYLHIWSVAGVCSLNQ